MDTNTTDLGSLQTVAGGQSGPDGVWGGSISAAGAEPLPDLASYFVAAEPAASTRCIDGRGLAGYSAEAGLQSRPLGPQIAGGTPVVALLYHLVGEPNDTVPTLDQDLATVIDRLSAAHIGIGGHVDDRHGPADEDTGCGAIDKMIPILDKLQHAEASAAAVALASKLLGGNLDPVMVDQLLRRVKDFRLSAEHYFVYNQQSDRYDYKQHAVAQLRQKASKDPVEVLTGAHQEKGLVVNTIDGTTFNRDAFAQISDGAVQLFDYDVWFVGRVAKALFPEDEAKQNQFVLLHVLYSIAAAMILTDGSLKLIVR